MNRTTQSLILNVIFPSLLIGLVAGAFVGYFMGKQAPVTIASKLLGHDPASTLRDAQVARNEKEAKVLGDAPANAFPKAPAPQTESAGTQNTEILAPGDYPSPAPELMSKLSDKAWTPGIVQSKDRDEKTGATETTETLPDGASANREYRPDGSLKAESVTEADGTNLNRSFFENGNVKIALVKEPNGAETSVLYDSTGVVTQHTTSYPDQTRIYSEYDDRGNVTNTWRQFPDGHTEPYPPEEKEPE